MTKPFRILTVLLAFILFLNACNFSSATPTQQSDPNAIFTAAAQTVEVQLTQNALVMPTQIPTTAVPPTSPLPQATQTPLPALETPTNTPAVALPTAAPVGPVVSTCDSAMFMEDVTVPDGTEFKAGASFVKTWRLKNMGSCTWSTAYALVFDSGEAMGGAASTTLPGTVAPGQTVDVSVNLQAPSSDGTYRGYWGIKNASGSRVTITSGNLSVNRFYVEIKVGTGVSSGATSTAGPSPTAGPTVASGVPTATPSKFAVTNVSFSASRSGDCTSASGKYVVTAVLTGNREGTVTYNWVLSSGSTLATESISFDAAGTKTIQYEWVTTDTNLTVELYVDKPNHQQFGTATLKCP